MVAREREIPLSVLIRYFRVPTVDIAVDYPGREVLLGSRITNLSVNGVFVRTKRPLDEGTALTISFHLPGNRQGIVAETVVRWRTPEAGGRSRGEESSGMGLEFTKIGKREQKAIERHVRLFLERMRRGG